MINTILIFREKVKDTDIYIFDVVTNDQNLDDIWSQKVEGYVLVNSKTKTYLASEETMWVLTNQHFESVAEKLENEGKTEGLDAEEAVDLRFDEAKKLAVESLLKETEEVAKFFENSEK